MDKASINKLLQKGKRDIQHREALQQELLACREENAILKDKLFEVQHLQIKDGDTVILKYPGQLKDDAIAKMRDSFKLILQDKGYKNVDVLVLTGGLDMWRWIKEQSPDGEIRP